MTADPSDVLGPLREPAAPVSNEPPPVHPRDAAMQSAGAELALFFQQWRHKFNLTPFEYLYLLSVLVRGMTQAQCLIERENKPT